VTSAAARTQATWCATVVDQWVLDGVTDAVVAPGSRSTPMALAMAAHAGLRVHVVHDERSASFVALGMGLASGVPALLLCTSGTAATHFHGAVAEAHLSGIPLLVLTADRPPELRDVGAPQTIDQTKLYGDAVRWFHDSGVPDAVAAHTWRALARHALECTVGPRPGPVHVNLPFREPLVAEPDELPPARLGARIPTEPASRLSAEIAEAVAGRTGVIVAGAGVDDPAAVVALSAATGWPVLADPRSRCRGAAGVITAGDALLRVPQVAACRPDVVLHLGEPPASKVLGQWVAQLQAVQVRVTPHDRVIDPSHTTTHRVVSPIGAWCTALADLASPAPDAWTAQWTAWSHTADAALAAEFDGDAELTEPAVARALTRLPGHLVVASSMPVRDVEWFGAPDQAATVWSNRGANGIDGTVATAIGIAAATDRPVTVLLGDVALLHDATSLTALARRPVDVRIVVVDNDGGGIFSFLPQATSLPTERFEQLFGTPHGTDLVALATAHGIPATEAHTPAELASAVAEAGTRLVLVRSRRAANVDDHERLNAAVTSAIG
jgi:2-succinyl-5-enolpyruvyl-6-hydroxy-3-cyclohexene-1-carboxylate synthase